MSTTQYVQLEPRNHNTAWRLYRAMVGLGVLCAIIIVSVFEYTAPMIQQNKRDYLEQSIYQLLPTARHVVQYEYHKDSGFSPVQNYSDTGEIYSAYNKQQQFIGLVIKAQGIGYQDKIVFLYSYLPDKQIVNGFQVLESRETPGLGTRIETDKQFLNNFSALDVGVADSADELKHPIEVIKPGNKQHDWQIDTITGATISSRAVAQTMQQSTAYWIPKLKHNLEAFQHAPN